MYIFIILGIGLICLIGMFFIYQKSTKRKDKALKKLSNINNRIDHKKFNREYTQEDIDALNSDWDKICEDINMVNKDFTKVSDDFIKAANELIKKEKK